MQTTSIRFDQETKEKLEILSLLTGGTISDIVRRALGPVLDEHAEAIEKARPAYEAVVAQAAEVAAARAALAK